MRRITCTRLLLLVLFVSITTCLWLRTTDARAEGIFFDLPHHYSSFGGTESNYGHNYVQAGYETANGLTLAAGGYFISGDYCAPSVTIGQRFAKHWYATMSLHDEAICELNGTDYFVDGNIGFGVMRLFTKSRYTLGLGMGLWEHSDEAVGNHFEGRSMQLTAGFLLRFHARRQ